MRYYLLLIFCSFCWNNSFSQVVINEYSASNLNEIPDNHDKYEDWVELYNDSDTPADISGWYLSDKLDNPTKWQFPEGTIIEARDYLLIWCSDRNTVEGNHYHTNFKLTQTKENEFVVLSRSDGSIVESYPLRITQLHHTNCRNVDGASGQWIICKWASPAATNNQFNQYDRYAERPALSLDGGFYNGPQMISIESQETDATIYYTLDGTNPRTNDMVYSGPFEITETTHVKAIVIHNDPRVAPSLIDYDTYFIDESFTLPVISAAGDQLLALLGGNRDLRPIGSIEYFENGQRIAESYGEMNSHGQDSWINPQRSFDWVSRDEMGYNKAIFAQLFTYSERDEHQRLMMRCSGDDNYPAFQDMDHEGSTHVRDEYVHELALRGNMNLDVRAVERVVVYANGNYWGVYAIRERPVDHDYTNYVYDQGKYDLHYLLTWGQSWAEYGGQAAFDDWGNLRDHILFNDMSDSSNYQLVKDKMRLTSLIDYMIANLASVASDWLNYNTGWWRGTKQSGDHKKWGYILWDNDATFDYYINYSGVPNTDPDAVPCDINEISNFMDNFFPSDTSFWVWMGDTVWQYPDPGKHEKIFLKLQQENEEFRQLYYSRFADLMNTVYTCDNMLSVLDSMVATIAPEMPRHIDRWGRSMDEWTQNLEDLRDFVEQRCVLIPEGMNECYNLTGPYPITLFVEPDGIGEIDINTLDIEEFPWTGNYFGNMDNLIKARSFDDDWEFSHWESKNGNIISPDTLTRRARIQLSGPDTLIAYFKQNLTSVNEIQNVYDFRVYPTIVDQNITVEFQMPESEVVQLSLYNSSGQLIHTFREVSGNYGTGPHQINLSLDEHVAPGLYLLRFNTSVHTYSRRITVIK